MLRLASMSALTVLLLTGQQSARADDPASAARAIIAKALEAQGGAALLDKYQAATAKFKGRFHGEFGDGDMQGTIRSQGSDKLRLDMTMKLGGADVAMSQVVDGNKAWVNVNGNTQELDKEQMTEAREQIHAGQIADLRGLDAKDVKVSVLGESKVGDKSVVGVRVSAPGHRDVNLYFDKDKGLLVKSETRVKDMMTGGESTEVKLYSDYKKVSGLAVAHKIETQHDGKPHAESEITEITLAEKLPDSTFAKP
jgi:outer membrane lipoprotein-sorting protein